MAKSRHARNAPGGGGTPVTKGGFDARAGEGGSGGEKEQESPGQSHPPYASADL